MKKGILYVLVVCSFIFVSCTQQNFDCYNKSLSNDIFESQFEGATIPTISAIVNKSQVYSTEGEFYFNNYLYDFCIKDEYIEFARKEKIELTNDYLPTLQEIKDVFIRVDAFLSETYKLKDYKIKLFTDKNHLSIFEEISNVHLYDYGRFSVLEGVVDVNGPCLLIYGERISIIIIL